MKLIKLIFLSFLLYTISCSQEISNNKVYYAIEINGVLCGYTETAESNSSIKGRDYLDQDMHMFVMLSLFGSEFNTEMRINSLIDPVTKRCYQLNGEIHQGTVNRTFDVKVKDNRAIINNSFLGGEKTLELTPEILFGSDEVFSRVKKEFVENNAEELSLDILEAIDSEVQTSTFRKIGEEKIELAGKPYETIIIEQINKKTGVNIKYWLSPDLDYFAMFTVLNRKIYLTDHMVVDKIKVADVDASILTRTNKSITDIQALSYMKLKVEIQPTGINLRSEDLNIPGQKFEGTVEKNVIKGIMEIQYERYSGENAPSFPADYSNDKSLQKYLEPSLGVEADDPVLAAKAKEITKDAKDSWEAARMLSKWVADEIHYAIPGGGTARGTFDIRAGECGGHSMLLTAFCRAVGIPARVVFGGMYVPNMGGAFGQHGWNEIYMGEAGWIPVDATAFETDYVDAGHIRISEHLVSASTFNAKSIEILDYKLINEGDDFAVSSAEKFAVYMGKYKNPESGKVFEVLVKEGNLSVDIPGKMVLPFNEEDENGRWYCKLSNRLYIQFHKAENEEISHMILHELVAMPRQNDTTAVPEEIPEDLKLYIGNYYFAAVNAVFRVEFVDNTLGIYDPTKDRTVKLQSPDENGGWLDEFGKNTVYFETDPEGNVAALKIDTAAKFIRE
jgi:transglutaminase-like putative cysteine protease